jgi:hypothetical protein
MGCMDVLHAQDLRLGNPTVGCGDQQQQALCFGR